MPQKPKINAGLIGHLARVLVQTIRWTGTDLIFPVTTVILDARVLVCNPFFLRIAFFSRTNSGEVQATNSFPRILRPGVGQGASRRFDGNSTGLD